MIIIDTREPKEEVQYFDKHKIEYVREALPCGDYASEDKYGNRVIIERKEVLDFISSLFEGRLDDQMRRLSQQRLPILVLAGDLEDYYKKVPDSKFTRDQFYGAISSCIVRYGLRSVLWVQGPDCCERSLHLINHILSKVSENKLDDIPNRKIKGYNAKAGLLRIILNCPQDLAVELLEEYKTIKNIIELPTEKLREFKGLGPKRIERMQNLMGLKIE